MTTPTPRQIRHHQREFYGFVHFTVNTFTDREWGMGDESPSIFNPTDFDADQIVDSAKLAGMKGLILTAKHHDGFCLWPTTQTGHSVTASPFRGGKGDVVREMQQACQRGGIELGLYLSPWDRNHPEYGRPEYVQVYRKQLRELMTGYGELFEIWFDGANGGDGYYGGAREKRNIDNTTYYGWEQTWQLVRDLQPNAVMFSDAGPDVRWVGNEAGIAGDPCWCAINGQEMIPGHADRDRLNRGDRDGAQWRIPECDVSIRPGWFYHPAEDSRVRSAKTLVDLYFASVGRGTTMLLNLPPDRRGRIHDIDRSSLRGFRGHLDRLFADNIAAGATRTLGWRTGDKGREWMIAIDLAKPRRVNVVELREDISLGHRAYRWVLEAGDEKDHWRTVTEAESIGQRRLIRFEPTVARRFRIRITDCCDQPEIVGVGLYLEPELAEIPAAELGWITAEVSQPSSNELVLDMGRPTALQAVCYSPNVHHRADRYEIAFATVAGQWGGELSGEFGNMMFNPAPQSVACDVTTRYVRFRATRFCVGDRLGGRNVNLLGK